VTGAAKLVSPTVASTCAVAELVLMMFSDDVLRMSSGLGLAGVPTELEIEPFTWAPQNVLF